MNRAAPKWLSRTLGLPGSVSFRRFDSIVDTARAHVDELRGLSDHALRTEADSLSFATGGALDVDATARFLAIAQEAAARTVGLTAFDEQLAGCCALLAGHAVEMDTGEGKTLVGALAAAGHALGGRKVHVVSVNDYLAERDAGWMRPFFDLLGVSVGWCGWATLLTYLPARLLLGWQLGPPRAAAALARGRDGASADGGAAPGLPGAGPRLDRAPPARLWSRKGAAGSLPPGLLVLGVGVVRRGRRRAMGRAQVPRAATRRPRTGCRRR